MTPSSYYYYAGVTDQQTFLRFSLTKLGRMLAIPAVGVVAGGDGVDVGAGATHRPAWSSSPPEQVVTDPLKGSKPVAAATPR